LKRNLYKGVRQGKQLKKIEKLSDIEWKKKKKKRKTFGEMRNELE
jgi:hypothetical protein